MSNVVDINEDQFVNEVIEKSKTIPVIVDFWAPWCGPCKQLTPTLEKVVNQKNGKVILAKINVDENQGIASQLNIQSIPTVYGFVDGKPIDAFHGAQPERKIELMDIARQVAQQPINLPDIQVAPLSALEQQGITAAGTTGVGAPTVASGIAQIQGAAAPIGASEISQYLNPYQS